MTYDPLRQFAEWIVNLDDPEGPGAEGRRTITLNKIIVSANEALALAEALEPDNNND